jgi:hypothetical protein
MTDLPVGQPELAANSGAEVGSGNSPLLNPQIEMFSTAAWQIRRQFLDEEIRW